MVGVSDAARTPVRGGATRQNDPSQKVGPGNLQHPFDLYNPREGRQTLKSEPKVTFPALVVGTFQLTDVDSLSGPA